MKKILYLMLMIIWLLVIFMFSSNNSNDSNILSENIVNRGIVLYEKITNININNSIMNDKLNYPIRKLAHYSIFFILGIFVFLYIKTTNIKYPFIISLLLCFVFASFDEIHQIFVNGRTPKIFDVFIDIFGSLSSIIILFLKFKNNRSKYGPF